MIRPMLLASLLALACTADAHESGNNLSTSNQGPASKAAASENVLMTRSELGDFEGLWEAASDDGSSIETASIRINGAEASGILKSLQRGYYSGRTTVAAEVAFLGTIEDGALKLEAWDVNNGSPQSAVAGRAFRRGEYLVIQIGTGGTSYARPGVSLVKSAEGSASALELANAIGGKIFSLSDQASGRGAMVGGRTRLALCADGSIAYDASDVASTGGADGVSMGSTTSRRGQWGIVLLAGLPAVKAQWDGTGSSYSLTRYFHVEPRANGAMVDGTELSLSGSC